MAHPLDLDFVHRRGAVARVVVAWCVLLSLSATCRAQAAPAQLSPVQAAAAQDVATVVVDAPMFWLKDTNLEPMRLLSKGSAVIVLAREQRWCRVVYRDARFGDDVGYVEMSKIRLDGGAGESRDGGTGAVSQRGFLEGRGLVFPQTTPGDTVRTIGDLLFREEVFVKPRRWLQLAAGLDLRANSYDQVEDEWRLDFEDRRRLRPRASVRRLSATFTTSHFTLNAGKQVIRWGRADILAPTDRFAPKDYVNVIDNEVLPVTGVRTSLQFGSETVEGIWVAQMTPSRLPILNQRWGPLPPEAARLSLEDRGSVFPEGSEQGFRWSHSGRVDLGVSYFNGFNHLPDVQVVVVPGRQALAVTRTYPALRTFGAEASIPTPVLTLKGELAYFRSPTSSSEEYVLWVLEAERQVGEWLLDGGYVGEAVTSSRPGLAFGPERGIGKSFIGRASYTVDPRRTVAVEGAVRQNGNGAYIKGEYSNALAQHWRVTFAGVGIAGSDDDFVGQYRRNSYLSTTLRFSF